jgi:hypothetical protein
MAFKRALLARPVLNPGWLGYDHDLLAIATGMRALDIEVSEVATDTAGGPLGGVELARDVPVIGDLAQVRRAVHELGGACRDVGSYPEAVTFTHRGRLCMLNEACVAGRPVWRARMGDVIDEVLSGKPRFIKSMTTKTLSGAVFRTVDDLVGLLHIDEDTEVWCADVVSFSREVRCFFDEAGRVVHVGQYRGEPACDELPARQWLEHMGRALARETAVGVIDIGQRRDSWPRWEVVEAGSGPCFGLYGMPPVKAAERYLRAWAECFR